MNGKMKRGLPGLGVRALAGIALLGIAAPHLVRAGAGGSAAPPDTSGMAQMEWAYDTWTVPWVQVKGVSPVLAPSSHATLMVLDCASADLEQDRRARHLSRDECEHRMAAIRADLDTALIFRLDLRAFSVGPSAAVVRLSPQTTVTLEDDRGRSWSPIDVRPGPTATVATGLTLNRFYQPPWLRGGGHQVGAGRELTIAEHVVRFARRDSRFGEPLVSSGTRWLRLRMTTQGHEWIATWTFRTFDDRGL